MRVTRQRYEALEPCLMCHFTVGLPNAWAARLLGTQKTWPGKIRRRRGLAVPSRAEANRRTAVRNGNARPEAWGKQRPDSVEAWQEWAFMREQKSFAKHEATTSWTKSTSWYERNRSYVLSNCAEYNRRKYNSDPQYRFKCLMRNQVKRIFRKANAKKIGRTIDYLGCSMNEARQHIERQFKRGMHWNNHGKVWEIDHIIPLAEFDLTDPRQRKMAGHFTNLRPLWREENQSKRDKITQPHQLALL